MLKLEEIRIEEFRGIRKLDIAFKGTSFGICGPNGTGKSGVVDAIEFCLTGDVTRLSGRGTADLSVTQHAPHVDKSGVPELARVRLIATIPSLKKKVTIERTVANPRRAKVTPADPTILKIAEDLESHPEFALSRREIVKYIMTPPGDRAKDVQNLLRLEEIEQIRTALTGIANDCKRKVADTEAQRSAARADFMQALGLLGTSNLEAIVPAINERRSILGLEPIIALAATTSFRSGDATTEASEKPPTLTRASALGDVTALQADAIKPEDDTAKGHRLAALEQLTRLREDATAFRLLRQRQLVTAGLELVESDACPLCDLPWDADDLRAYLTQKLANAESTGEQLRVLASHAQTTLNAVAVRISQLGRLLIYCRQLQPAVDADAMVKKKDQLTDLSDGLTTFIADQANLDRAIAGLSLEWWTLNEQETACLTACRAAIDALPAVSKEDQAKHELSIAQERYEKSVTTTAARRAAVERQRRADAVLAAFGKSVKDVLDAIYEDVAGDFARFYRTLNREDEAGFRAELNFPAPARLSLDVDFYGRGLFPPGAYHSEGHQDGMGLCLYLALMKHTLGDGFTFSVLDDVVMSVDAGHRRELCRLLRSEFPHTQFVLTTHDRVWLQYMRSEALVERSQTFGGWSVDSGPRIWNDLDVWQEIESELAKTNIPTAAHYLRRYLEHVAFGLADALRARVEFHGDGQYDLNDLLPPALSQWRSKLNDGLKVAQRWKQTKNIELISALIEKTKATTARSEIERWAINRSVHYNEWANLQPDEFRAVALAFRELLDMLKCTSCGSFVVITPRTGASEAIRCTCGDFSINLVGKQKSFDGI